MVPTSSATRAWSEISSGLPCRSRKPLGSVTARAAATVSAPAAGTLADLRVEPGQRVSKGQVLAVIDAPELEQRRDAAQEALDQASRGGGSTGVAAPNAAWSRVARYSLTARFACGSSSSDDALGGGSTWLRSDSSSAADLRRRPGFSGFGIIET